MLTHVFLKCHFKINIKPIILVKLILKIVVENAFYSFKSNNGVYCQRRENDMHVDRCKRNSLYCSIYVEKK